MFHSVSFSFCIRAFDFIFAFFLFALGVRIVQVAKPQYLLEILNEEIDYLEHCVDHPFGKCKHETVNQLHRRWLSCDYSLLTLTLRANWSQRVMQIMV